MTTNGWSKVTSIPKCLSALLKTDEIRESTIAMQKKVKLGTNLSYLPKIESVPIAPTTLLICKGSVSIFLGAIRR